jgi:hypothetical protein
VNSTTSPDNNVSKLALAKTLLDKLWVRHKNQHRTQPWWKSLSCLRKAVARLSQFEGEEQSLRAQSQTSALQMSARDARRRFERESELRAEKSLWMERVRETLVPTAYLNVSAVVADVQFANVGVVLVGILADVMSIVGPPSSIQADRKTEASRSNHIKAGRKEIIPENIQAGSLKATSLRVTGLQSGELVERQYESDDLGEVVERANIEHQDLSIPDATPAQVSSEPTDSHDGLRGSPDRIHQVDKPVHPADNTPSVPRRTEGTRAKDKSGRKTKTKKKSAIDDLFAGLT